MEELSDQHQQEALLKFCADAKLLALWCDPTALDQLGALCRSRGIKLDKGARYHAMVNGYKLVAGTALYNLLDVVVQWPEVLGIEEDDQNLRIWWHFAQSGGPGLHAAFTDIESTQARIASHVEGVMTTIRVASNWDDMSTALREAGQIGKIIAESPAHCSVSMFNEHATGVDVDDALLLRAMERLLDYLEYGRTLQSAYGFIWRGHDQKGQNTTIPLSDIKTHIDHHPLAFNARGSVSQWKSGVTAAMLIALQRVGAIEDTDEVYEVFERIMSSEMKLRDVIHHFVGQPYPSLEFGLQASLALSAQDWEVLQSPANPRSAKERLESLLGNEFRVIAADNVTDGMDLWDARGWCSVRVGGRRQDTSRPCRASAGRRWPLLVFHCIPSPTVQHNV